MLTELFVVGVQGLLSRMCLILPEQNLRFAGTLGLVEVLHHRQPGCCAHSKQCPGKPA